MFNKVMKDHETIQEILRILSRSWSPDRMPEDVLDDIAGLLNSRGYKLDEVERD